jgi:hypothetical protein
MRSANHARAAPARMEGPDRVAIAFCKTGGPQLGEWDDAVVLGRYGDVSDDLVPYTSDYAFSNDRNAVIRQKFRRLRNASDIRDLCSTRRTVPRVNLAFQSINSPANSAFRDSIPRMATKRGSAAR